MLRFISYSGRAGYGPPISPRCARPQLAWRRLRRRASHAMARELPRFGVADTALAKTAQTARPDTRGWTYVIVQVAPGADVEAVEKAIAQTGGDITRHLSIIQSVAVRVPTKNLNALAQTAGIAHISRDVATKRHADEFTVQHTGADIATASPLSGGYGLSGSGVTVAVLDSGIKDSADFKTSALLSTSRVLANVNFVSSGGTASTSNTDDKLGHGTHVAGIIAGNGLNSSGLQYFRTFTGIAPSASLVNVRVLDDQGSGTVSDVVAGLNWIVQNKAKYNIRVVNVSLGHPVYESYKTDPLNLAVEAAWKAGIVVVCSAGNTGRQTDAKGAYSDNEGFGAAYGTIQCPGNDPLVITVGATKNADANRANDKIATYSSRGPSRLDMVMKPDLVAPGNRVISVCADGSTLDNAYGRTNDIRRAVYQYNTNQTDWSKTYYVLSGTSMAVPVVSGAAALLLSKDSNLSPDTIKARLMLSANKWKNANGTPDVLSFGAGYLNIPAALDNKTVVATTSYAVSPVLIVQSDGKMKVSLDATFWVKSSLWGTSINQLQMLWGTSAISGNTVWGDQALVGESQCGAVGSSAVGQSQCEQRGHFLGVGEWRIRRSLKRSPGSKRKSRPSLFDGFQTIACF